MLRPFKDKIVGFLKRGLSPQCIARAVALGIVLGVFPIYGPVSLICLGLAFLLRLNITLLFVGTWVMTFVKPVLILPFLRLGEFLFSAEPMPISIQELWIRFSENALGTLVEFSWSFLHATVGWLVVAPLVFIAAYPLVLALALRWRDRMPMG